MFIYTSRLLLTAPNNLCIELVITGSYHKLFGSKGYQKVTGSCEPNKFQYFFQCNNHKQCCYCFCGITSDNRLVTNLLIVLLLPNTT